MANGLARGGPTNLHPWAPLLRERGAMTVILPNLLSPLGHWANLLSPRLPFLEGGRVICIAFLSDEVGVVSLW